MATGAKPSSGTFSTSNANDLIIVAYSDNTGGTRSITVPTNYTSFAQETNGSTYSAGDGSYRIVSSAQTNISPQWTITTATSWYACGVAYQQALTSATPNPGIQSGGALNIGIKSGGKL